MGHHCEPGSLPGVPGCGGSGGSAHFASSTSASNCVFSDMTEVRSRTNRTNFPPHLQSARSLPGFHEIDLMHLRLARGGTEDETACSLGNVWETSSAAFF